MLLPKLWLCGIPALDRGSQRQHQVYGPKKCKTAGSGSRAEALLGLP